MKLHFIGIGGTGMGALACMLHDAGHEVRGSDTALYPPMSLQLSRANIPVATPFSAQNLDWGPDCVVVGNICSREHEEVVAATQRGLPLESMPSMLAKSLLPGRQPLVVAGTHGKTTTSAVLTWMLRCARQEPSWFIGGIPIDLGTGGHVGMGSAMVLEGDEYDTAFFDKGSKFLHYQPSSAILTNVEFDHADIFADFEAVRASFRRFVELLPPTGRLMVCATDPEAVAVARRTRAQVVTYAAFDEGLDVVGAADYVAIAPNRLGARRTHFHVYERGEPLGEFSTSLLGLHNVANIVGAIALARAQGCETAALQRAVATFRGVRRRQELVGTAQGVRIVQDFAHHPTAVRATVSAIRRRYPEKSLHVCFEPRSASSRRAVFAQGYREAFDLAGAVYIGPLYAAHKVPEADRLDTAALAAGLRDRGVEATAYDGVDELATAVLENAGPGDSVLVLSSGGFEGLPYTLLRRLGDPVTPMTPEDVRDVDQLLASYGLPCLVAVDRLESRVIRGKAGIAGCVHLELAGDSAYFFGLAVVRPRRGEGFGWVLADSILRQARTLGVKRVYLFPRDSGDFFATKLGFRLVDPSGLDPAVRNCANFEPSLEGAACMVCELETDELG
ncbi:MAG: hypothetical protein B7733_12095 [Myxococcales bacterium FL481]|nr:MAG: hypothetical protein B7733_12095 [Myxococcales bacterium FL481]